VPPGDVRALADAIQRMRDLPDEELARWGAEARRRHVARHTPAVHAGALAEAYGEAARRRAL